MQAKFYCAKAVAVKMMDRVLELFPEGDFHLWDGFSMPGTPLNPNYDITVWEILGWCDKSKTLRVSEWAGYLNDRLTNPLPGIDQFTIMTFNAQDGRQPKPSNPNPKLFVQNSGFVDTYLENDQFYLGTFVELAWR
jgi:hypothetical protein